MTETIKITPTQYFDNVKSKKHLITDEDLSSLQDNYLELAKKYSITGQSNGLAKLVFHYETVLKERELVKLGFNTFVYKDDVNEFADDIENNAVCIIELHKYEREIPDDITAVISKTKHIFDEFFVIFTDYTGKVSKQVKKEQRDKDPILFGTFAIDENNLKTLNDRFYYLGDWEDEYCDLTLEKMINQTRKKKNKDISHTFNTPKNIEEVKIQLAILEKKNNSFRNIDKFFQSKNPIRKFINFITRKWY